MENTISGLDGQLLNLTGKFMYYKKHTGIPSLPNDIKQQLIQIAEQNQQNNVPMSAWYPNCRTTDTNNILFEESNTQFCESGGVGFYLIPPELIDSICKFYKTINHPDITFNYYYLQIVTGGNFVAPHIDDPQARINGMLYLLKAGGADVRTTWYEVKPDYQHLALENYSAIPYSKLDQIEDHWLEEDMWHWLNFNKIHGVTNQESLRIALWGTYS